MKKLIILLLSMIYFNANAQEVHLAIDPYPLYDGQGIDITFGANTPIINDRLFVGLLFEWFPNKEYFSYQGILDYPIWITEKIETRLGVEYGRILRDHVITHKGYPENGTSMASFITYGVNGQVNYWFTEHIGAFSCLNYKYRGDSVYLWEDAATVWEYSVRIGIKYKF